MNKNKIKNIKRKKILVTGGLGYIGSHTTIELIEKNYEVVIIDNLSNSEISVLKKIELITEKKIEFYDIDIRDYEQLKRLFNSYNFYGVIHFAGLKSVADSIKNPKLYHENNVVGSQNLLGIMSKYEVNKFIFSSSATVYGKPNHLPLNESHPLNPVNPYGKTKLAVENMCRDIVKNNNKFSCIVLRYFNPIGAHKSALIGESPTSKPNNLLPYLCKVTFEKNKKLVIYGADYPTDDGSGVRDFIHILDIATGHISALEYVNNKTGFKAINLGTGKGVSVIKLINEFERVNNVSVPTEIGERRDGDVPESYADVRLAFNLLNWKASYNLAEMLEDAWRWQIKKN